MVFMKKIAIIGAGAAGLAAAVAAGEATRRHSTAASITVYESSDRVGRSILATGNGRCNFSNALIDPALYVNGFFVEGTLCRLSEMEPLWMMPGLPATPNAVVSFFVAHGLLYREESEGRLYPAANKASVVLDVLLSSARAAGATFETGCTVVRIDEPKEEGKPFTLCMADGALQRFDAVILACGGAVASSLLPDTFSFRPLQPVLCPIATDVRQVRTLDNIRVKGSISLLRQGHPLATERGEILFRKYGVSGIAVFNLSRFARPGDELNLDLVPDVDEEELMAYLAGRQDALRSIYGALSCEAMVRGMLLPLVGEAVLASIGLEGERPFEEAHLRQLAHCLKAWQFPVEGLADTQRCQVHRGGFAVEGFDPASCMAYDIPGLYVVGEALDVDAPCGGFNLHWAWASGIVAADHAICS